MNLLKAIAKAFPETDLDFNENFESPKNKEEVFYRKNGTSIDKIIEFDHKTGSKIKATYFDYFDDNKIKSVDEYDLNSGKKIRTINYVLYKSIDEYDIDTGKKIRTINYNIKDESKISSIQEYDLETGKITTITIYKRDGKTVGIVKHIDPVTEKVTNWINHEPLKVDNFKTRCYDNITTISSSENIAELIDNLYSKKFEFGKI